MTKKELRKIYREKRLVLTAGERMKMDDLMLIQFQRLSFGDGVSVLLNYFPMESKAEINTLVFERYLQHTIPGLNIGYPIVDFTTSAMTPYLVDEETEFLDNVYGIPEPVNGEKISPEEIDLVIVPLLAFDERGFRVGFGKGFYDRFLSRCRPDVITAGFSYFEPVTEIKDTNEFDVPLNYCITPYQLYEFK